MTDIPPEYQAILEKRKAGAKRAIDILLVLGFKDCSFQMGFLSEPDCILCRRIGETRLYDVRDVLTYTNKGWTSIPFRIVK